MAKTSSNIAIVKCSEAIFKTSWVFSRITRLIFGQSTQNNPCDSQKDDFSWTLIHVFSISFTNSEKNWGNSKKQRDNFQSHFVQKFIGRLVCYTDLNEARRFVKDIYIVLSTERSSVFVEYYVHKELKIKSTILIMLKMKIKKIP